MAVAVERLAAGFPLIARHRSLPPHLRSLHLSILAGIAATGRAPAPGDEAGVTTLAERDLVVVAGGEIVGAYPFSLRPTPHRLRLDDDVEVFAMCSIDALAVAPVWGIPTRIESRCAVGDVPLEVEQTPSSARSTPDGLRVGIRWQAPTGSAAGSMCRQMVFLADAGTAREWQAAGSEASVYSLDEGVDFARGFFGPLMAR